MSQHRETGQVPQEPTRMPSSEQPGIWPPPAPPAAFIPAPAETKGNRKHLVFGGVGLGFGVLIGLALGQINLPYSSGAITAAAETCDVVDTPGIYIGDNGQSITMSSEGKESSGAAYGDVYCVLGELEIPDSVDSRISSTRALDGRQTAEWDEFSASWGYHPDDGLNIVVEISDK
ncbi:hypothetical protein [Arthrobacter sp. ZGTC212]|uniref:hypothetical protein n=1 Tax=Arthrobacter sp. ZGTC212 TaxID=2058899 RepID=UPI0011B031AD|nr:hypothetical protein [Arthrobacter sp. ZGTC212]